MSVHEILEACRGLPRPEQLRLVAELERELAQARPAETAPASNPFLEERGRLLVYAGPFDVSILDHRAAREARIDQLIARTRVGRD